MSKVGEYQSIPEIGGLCWCAGNVEEFIFNEKKRQWDAAVKGRAKDMACWKFEPMRSGTTVSCGGAWPSGKLEKRKEGDCRHGDRLTGRRQRALAGLITSSSASTTFLLTASQPQLVPSTGLLSPRPHLWPTLSSFTFVSSLSFAFDLFGTQGRSFCSRCSSSLAFVLVLNMVPRLDGLDFGESVPASMTMHPDMPNYATTDQPQHLQRNKTERRRLQGLQRSATTASTKSFAYTPTGWRERWDKWMINEGGRRVFFFLWVLLHLLVYSFGEVHYTLKDNLTTANATFGVTFGES
jgi:hypothetical protein